MTARTDLENAFSILDAGITAHVEALRASKAAHAVSQAIANDDSYIQTLTSKVLSWADTLAQSNPATVVAAPVTTPSAAPSPVVLAGNAPAVLTPEAQVTAQLTQVLAAVQAAPAVAPVAPVAVTQVIAPAVTPVVAAVEPVAAHVPSVMETMQAVINKMTNL